MVRYGRKDIVNIAERVYSESGNKAGIIQSIKNYDIVPKPENIITNFYYISKNVFDYNHLNGFLSLAVMFLDAAEKNNEEKVLRYGNDYKEIILQLAETNLLIDHHFCDKAFDGYKIALIAHSWLYVRESGYFATVFTATETKIVEDWIYKRAKLMYEHKDDGVYETFRPYDNQEIVIGVLSILARVLQEKDPELSKGFHEIIDQRLVGWDLKLENPDDTLFYTPILIANLYFYALYRPNPNMLGYENLKKTFESFLQKTAPDGQVPLYNWMFAHSYADVMALGAKLYNDGRFQWMANKILHERIESRPRRYEYSVSKVDENRLEALDAAEKAVIETEIEKKDNYDHVWEGLASNLFHMWLFWDDNITPVQPTTGSVLLEKSAGDNSWPLESGPIIPEKIVFRDGWNDDDLQVILNLWGGQNHSISDKNYHRYPATNEILIMNYEEPFVVQATNIMSRDVNVKREELNAFNIKRNNEWINEHEKTYNAQINFFETLDLADLSKTKLHEYFGWENERTCLLVKNDYFVVFDYCHGAQKDDIGVLWHLKGEVVEQAKDQLQLQLFDKKLSIHYPHEESWYAVETKDNATVNPVYQRHADLDLTLMADDTQEKGFITVFAPDKGEKFSVRVADVKYFDKDAYPLAFGAVVERDCYTDLIGVRNNKFSYPYIYEDDLMTDMESFILRRSAQGIKINFANGKMMQLRYEIKPKSVAFNGKTIPVKYKDGNLIIDLGNYQSGVLDIKGGDIS